MQPSLAELPRADACQATVGAATGSDRCRLSVGSFHIDRTGMGASWIRVGSSCGVPFG